MTTEPTCLEAMRDFVVASPYVRSLAIELVALGPDRAELRVTESDGRLVARGSVVHQLG